MAKRYQVVAYSEDNLVALFLTGAFNHRDSYIREKPQIRYLLEYCASIGTKTLVYEPEYVDFHFSTDHSGYYARCFELYPKMCSRIHFFGVGFTERTLSGVLSGKSRCLPAQFSTRYGYRGFIVVKPLPETVVGRTCLVAPVSIPEINFPTLHAYSANLFGIPVAVNSLPFQEQDHEVAACATSALWSVVHGTARAFQHAVFSPLEITRTALATLPLFGRALPNDGLSVYQMAGVVRQLGLEADLVEVSERYLLQSCCYAYLRGGVPPLLGVDFNYQDREHPQLHAVAVVGYELGGPVIPFELNEFRLRATRMTRLFVHDDGVGPFAPCTLGEDNLIATAWVDEKGGLKKACPSQLLIPLYQQIRTPFNGLLDAIMEFDNLVEALRSDLRTIHLAYRLEWDIYLVEVQRFKREILTDNGVSADQKRDILTRNLPRFLWRAIACAGAQDRKLDIIFDATDLLQGRQLVCSLRYDTELEAQFASEFRRVDCLKYLDFELTKNIAHHFMSKK